MRPSIKQKNQDQNTTGMLSKWDDSKVVLIISLFFVIVFVYSVIREYDLLRWTIENFSDAPAQNLFFLAPFIILPVGAALFWKRKTIGWVLLAVYITYTCTVMIIQLVNLLLWYFGSQEEEYLLLSETPPIADIVQLMILLLSLFVIGSFKIRRIYSIHYKLMLTIIFLTASLAIYSAIIL
jgi:hypothetical protein